MTVSQFAALAVAVFALAFFLQHRNLLRGLFLAATLAAGAVALIGKASVLIWIAALLGSLACLYMGAFLFLWIACAFVELNKPQEEDSPFYRRLAAVYIEALVTLVRVRIHTRGLDKVPSQGRFLLVCNHLFVADPGILLHVLPDAQLAFITKQENQKLFAVGKIMHKILCQPLDRENDRAALKVIRRCIQLLQEDKVSIAAYPEGYTSKDGKLHPFRSGIFRIAQKTGAPIVVCTIQNTRQIFKNLARMKHTDVEFHVVDVIPPQAVSGKSTVEIGHMVYERMISDLGESFRWIEPEKGQENS